MATDARISALPANPGVTSTDVLEVLDVSNTTNQATGENTKATVASLITGLPAMAASGSSHAAGLVPDPGATAGITRFLREDATFAVPAGGSGGSPFVAAGPSHAAGIVPDPGATTHATPYILGDDGTFHPLAGTALSYAGGTYTFTAGVGGSGTPGGTNGQIQYNNLGAFGGLASVPVANGGTGLIALPTANQILGVNAAASGYEGKTLTAGANVTITPSAGVLTIAATGGGSGSRIKQFSVTALGNLVTGTTPASLFQSPITVVGSRTIPANTLQQGSVISGYIVFDTKLNTGDTVTLTITLGGTTVLQGTSGAGVATVTAGVAILRFDIFFLTGGAAAISRNSGKFEMAALSAGATDCAIFLSSTGNGGASNAVNLDQTTALILDILASFSTTASGDGLRIDGGAMFIDV